MADIAARYHFADFTRENYRRLLRIARNAYAFCSYHDFNEKENFALWRHDVDYSMHAALALARIEAEEGERATYFLLPGSMFYNLFEPEVLRIIAEIRSLGHAFGLHFDATNYSITSAEALEKHLQAERRLLEEYCDAPMTAFSFHNPGTMTDGFRATEYAGMVNAYADYFRTDVEYVSDSNGIWRHKRLEDVLSARPPRLQVLTHPAWWSEEPMSPRARIMRCINGRARAVLSAYNRQLADDGRENVFELEEEFGVLEQLLGEQALSLQMAWLNGEREGVFLELWRQFGQGAEKKWQSVCDALMRGEHVDAGVLQEGVAHLVQPRAKRKAQG